MKEYTEADMINFGRYLLDPERMKRIREINPGTKLEHEVHHADILNWKHQRDTLKDN